MSEKVLERGHEVKLTAGLHLQLVDTIRNSKFQDY